MPQKDAECKVPGAPERPDNSVRRSYDGVASDKKNARVLEFGAAQLGHGKVKKATWCESLRPTHLVPAWAEANQHGTFGCLAITEQGELQFTVHDANAQKLYGAAVHPSKRR